MNKYIVDAFFSLNNTCTCRSRRLYLAYWTVDENRTRKDILITASCRKHPVGSTLCSVVQSSLKNKVPVAKWCIKEALSVFNSWCVEMLHQLDVTSQSFISQLIRGFFFAKCCHNPVIFKAEAWPGSLTVSVHYCKISNILYFQLLCFVICSFFIINNLYGVC